MGLSAEANEESLYSRYIVGMPTDLAMLSAITVLTVVSALLPVVRETVIRPIFGFLFVLSVPGYAILAALFPSGPRQVAATASSNHRIGWYEWIVLTTGLSISFIAVVGTVVNELPVEISFYPILTVAVVPTFAFLGIAVYRRQSSEAVACFDTSARCHIKNICRGVRSVLFGGSRVTNIALVVCIFLTAVSFGYVLQSSPEPSTSFYLLSEDENGNLSSSALPENASTGEEITLTVGVDNYEHRQVYTVVVSGQGTSDEVEQQRVDVFQLSRDSGSSLQREIDISMPEIAGQYSLTFRLYPGSSPSSESAYRTNTLKIAVYDE
jgi:uncharacterized membrane protein